MKFMVNILNTDGSGDSTEYDKMEKFFSKSLKKAIKNIENFLKQYKDEARKIYSKDLADYAKFIGGVQAELERLKDAILADEKPEIIEKNEEAFEALAKQFENGLITKDLNKLAGY